jgi:dihydroflavonol-4-reductase
MRIFVTGGTGLLGNTILRQLTETDHETLTLVRRAPESVVFNGIRTDFIKGDLLDQPAIDEAVARCDAVIHAAGYIHIGWRKLDESMRVNRDGTRAVVDACLKHGRRLVHVASTNTMAIGTRTTPADETTPLDNAGGQVPCNYVLSKRAAVTDIHNAIGRGLNAVIVCPGFMLGPWDWKPSSGRMMLEVGRGWKPVAPAGGCCVCDARDVAAAIIRAAEEEVESGREFILGGENCTYKSLWREMAHRMGKRGPLFAAGPVQQWIGGTLGDLWGMIVAESDVNSAGIRMTRQYHWYDSSRAQRELGYQIRDVRGSLDDTAQWIRQHHV